MTTIDKIKELHDEGRGWDEIAYIMGESENNHATPEAWRSRYRRGTGIYNREGRKTPDITEYTTDDILPPWEEKEKDDKKLLTMLRKPVSLTHLCEAFHMYEGDMMAWLMHLENKGYSIVVDGKTAWLDRGGVNLETHKTEAWDGRRTIRFLALSDTHLCSKWQQITLLNEAYDDAIARDCDFAVHCGDLTDGFYQNRPGHIYELFARGFDEQVDYVVANYPRRYKNGTPFITKMISGNHDHCHLKADGANIIKAFTRQRNDIEFLGDSYCKLWLTPECDMDIQHPTDGSQYAISYSSQKLIDAMQGGSKPKIYMIGHHHKGLYYLYRNIHTFEVPCLQAQTPFERGMKIAVMVGWWIITVEVEADGTVSRIVPEMVPRYEMKENDY